MILENSRQQTQKQEEQLESLKEQLASAKSKASEQETALKSAKEKVQTLLADYQTNAKQEEEQKQAYQSQQNQLFDRLDSLKTSRPRRKVWKTFLKP